MKYDRILNRLVAIACFAGPVLYLVAVATYLIGQPALEAVIGMFALTLFLPVHQAVAMLVGRRFPIFGVVIAVLGLFQAVGVLAYGARAFGQMLVVDGVLARSEEIFDLIDNVPAAYSYMGLALLTPVLIVLSAVGLWRTAAVPVWAALALFVGGVVFFLAQALSIAYDVTYPLYVALLLIGYVPVGVTLLRGKAAAGSEAESTSASAQ